MSNFSKKQVQRMMRGGPLAGGGGALASISGDSLGAINWAGSTPIFVVTQNAGAHEMANALAGRPLDIVANYAVGATTLTDQIERQLPQILAARHPYNFCSVGTNDLYAEGAAPATVLERMKRFLCEQADAGIVPIWSTVWARSYHALYTKNMLRYNDMLREWAYVDAPGMFWDGYPAMLDPADPDNNILAGHTYDTGPSLHTNNQGALMLGLSLDGQVLSKLPKRNRAAWGAEDSTHTADSGANLLSNPNFRGSSGTLGSNVTGTSPTGWTIDWATRTGSGTAVASIVNVPDPDNSKAVAQAIQLVVSGAPAAGDVLRIFQTGFENKTPEGAVVNCECQLDYGGTVGGVNVVRCRVQTNNSESAWWGNNSYASVAYSRGFNVSAKTRDLTSTGGGAARFDTRFEFTGAGTPTLKMYQPRVRRVR